jgi:hypothetical protein
MGISMHALRNWEAFTKQATRGERPELLPTLSVEYTFGFIGQGEHKIMASVAGASGGQNSCESASQRREFPTIIL